MQGICHNNDLSVDNETPSVSPYPYPPTTARRPEVAPNLEVVANATTLSYVQMHLISLGFSRATQSTSRMSRDTQGGIGGGTGGGTPPMVKWGRESGGGVEATPQALPNCQIALFQQPHRSLWHPHTAKNGTPNSPK